MFSLWSIKRAERTDQWPVEEREEQEACVFNFVPVWNLGSVVSSYEGNHVRLVPISLVSVPGGCSGRVGINTSFVRQADKNTPGPYWRMLEDSSQFICYSDIWNAALSGLSSNWKCTAMETSMRRRYLKQGGVDMENCMCLHIHKMINRQPSILICPLCPLVIVGSLSKWLHKLNSITVSFFYIFLITECSLFFLRNHTNFILIFHRK